MDKKFTNIKELIVHAITSVCDGHILVHAHVQGVFKKLCK